MYKETHEELMHALYKDKFDDRLDDCLRSDLVERSNDRLYTLRVLLANIIETRSPEQFKKEMGNIKKKLNALASINKEHEGRLNEVVMAFVEALRHPCPRCGRHTKHFVKGDYKRMNDLMVITPQCNNHTNLYPNDGYVVTERDHFAMEERRRELRGPDEAKE